jgi:hypothetical protein
MVFLAAATARADPHLTLKRESGSEDVTFSGQVAVWMLKDRVRHEIEGQVDLILRLDEQKLYLIDSRERSYTVIELRREGDGWAFKPKLNPYPRNLPGRTARIEPSGQTRQIGPWKAQQQRVTLSQNLEDPKVQTDKFDWWVAPDLQLEDGALRVLLRLLGTLSPNGDGWVATLLASGYPVRWDRVDHRSGSYGEYRWERFAREELLSVEDTQAPDHLYEPPSDYKPVDFDTYRKTHKLPRAAFSPPFL